LAKTRHLKHYGYKHSKPSFPCPLNKHLEASIICKKTCVKNIKALEQFQRHLSCQNAKRKRPLTLEQNLLVQTFSLEHKNENKIIGTKMVLTKVEAPKFLKF
jgi:hypothetical protein